LRLAIPRGVYTQSHIDCVAEIILRVWERRARIKVLWLTYEASFLRHFRAHLEPLG
jgi:tryptophanase